MEKQEENKKKQHPFKKGCIIVLIIFALILVKATFYFVGPLKVKIIDAKTDNPIANIKVEYRIFGYIRPHISAGGGIGWGDDRNGYTDNKGVFKIPLSIAMRIPFMTVLDTKRKLLINFPSNLENKSYDSYEEDFVWFPFRSFKFALVPIPKTLDDCRDNLTEEEQYRCVEMLARRDAGEVNKLSDNKIYDKYLDSKYLNILTDYCNRSNYLDNDCRAILAVNKKNKDVCLDKDLCLFFSAIDIRDKSWCEKIPEKKNNYSISRENCEYIIDTLDNK